MRSMFPSYNPSVPLGHQQYYPNMEVVPALSRIRDAAGPSSYISHLHEEASSTSLALPQHENMKKESPLRRSESLKRPTAFAKPEELLELWDISNGQAAEGAADSYALELSW